MENDFIGKASYGKTGGKDWSNANWRLEEGKDNIYQILPPFGLLAATGRWFFYDSIHWGYSSTTGKARPFRCIQRKNRKTKMIEIECPECTKIAETRSILETKEKEWMTQRPVKSKDEIKELGKPLSSWLYAHNNAKGFWLNVRRQDGQLGKLFLKITAKQSLDVALNDLRNKEGVDDPIAAGVWFNFQKIKGDNNRNVYPVSVVMNEVVLNGRKLKEVKAEPLSEDVFNRMKAESFELTLGYRDLSFDEIKQLVDSGGDPAITDTVFGVAKTTTVEENDFIPEDEQNTEPLPPVNDAEAVLLKQLEELRAKSHPNPSLDQFRQMFSGNQGK
jgi:hypothetical protein